jgi:hypothetical protein
MEDGDMAMMDEEGMSRRKKLLDSMSAKAS